MTKKDQKTVTGTENVRFVSKIAVGGFRTDDNGRKPSEIEY